MDDRFRLAAQLGLEDRKRVADLAAEQLRVRFWSEVTRAERWLTDGREGLPFLIRRCVAEGNEGIMMSTEGRGVRIAGRQPWEFFLQQVLNAGIVVEKKDWSGEGIERLTYTIPVAQFLSEEAP